MLHISVFSPHRLFPHASTISPFFLFFFQYSAFCTIDVFYTYAYWLSGAAAGSGKPAVGTQFWHCSRASNLLERPLFLVLLICFFLSARDKVSFNILCLATAEAIRFRTCLNPRKRQTLRDHTVFPKRRPQLSAVTLFRTL